MLGGPLPATIKDIAARLGISHSTVSRALGDFPYVSDALRRRVRETAAELNYRPNALARGLKEMHTRVVGLIIPDLMNDFYATAATIIQSTLAAEGYRLLLCVSGNDPKTELAYLRAMREDRIEGLIWVPRSTHDGALREYAEDDVPVIEFARKASRPLDAVLADDSGGAQAGTEHLLGLGHRRIGVIVGPLELSTGRERLEGYSRALRTADIEVDDSLVKVGRFDRAWGRQATEELCDVPGAPTAIFATSSELVLGALHGLASRGRDVPADISLVGFGDPDWFGVRRPSISTVRFATEEMATAAVNALLLRMHARPAPRQPIITRLSCSVVLRESTAPQGSARPRGPDRTQLKRDAFGRTPPP